MKFIGLKNFTTLFTVSPYRERFFGALKNNVMMFLMIMVLQNGLGLLLAVLLTRGLKGSVFFRTVFFSPVTISVVIVGFIWTLIYNPTWGVINAVLKALGLGEHAMAWLGDESTALLCVTIAGAWQSIGLSTMMFVAAIQGIPDDIVEAGRIDGCGEWQLFRHITFPMILPTIGMVSVLTLIGNFANSFDIIYAMQGALAGPNFSTDVLSTFFYRTAFGAYGSFVPDQGMGSAIAVMMFIIVLICVCIWFVLDAKNRRY
ncbi:MAG: carbohydrate ABC transporter permease [Candidatus Limivicinus sp.]